MEKIFERLQKVKSIAPLIHHITNYVTVRDCADITKCFGASPVMADAFEEVQEMANIANALVLNIGTLNSNIIESMKVAGKQANKKQIPIVLDICGVGATSFRNNKAKELLSSIKITVLKGNVSEIAAIAGFETHTKGVDAGSVETNIIELAKGLATKLNVVVVITGAEDIVSNGKDAYIVKNGCAKMGNIVGTGCMSSSIVGTFCAIEKNYALACVSALVCFEIVAELAQKEAIGLGTFKLKLFDKVSSLNETIINEMKNFTLI